MSSGDDEVKETYIIPKLPIAVDEMNTLIVKSAICNLIQDLNIDWNGPRPHWWPCLVPFQSPWKATEYKTGKLIMMIRIGNLVRIEWYIILLEIQTCRYLDKINGLRNAILVLYESRGLDPNTYVEGNEEEHPEEQHCSHSDPGGEQADDNQSSIKEPEFPKWQPYEYDGEDSILPPNPPCARLMPIYPSPFNVPKKIAIPAPLKLCHSVHHTKCHAIISRQKFQEHSPGTQASTSSAQGEKHILAFKLLKTIIIS